MNMATTPHKASKDNPVVAKIETLPKRELRRKVDGRRVRLTGPMLNDPAPIEVGEEGTIEWVDGGGTLHVKWDNGRTLGLVVQDEYEVLSCCNEAEPHPDIQDTKVHDGGEHWIKGVREGTAFKIEAREQEPSE